MNEKISRYVNDLFEPYDGAKSVAELKSDLLADLNERFAELTAGGKDAEAALAETLDSIGDIEETLGEMASLTHTLKRQVLVNFSAQELSDSDFTGVTLHRGKFNSSALKDADFSGADLTGSSFKASDLRGANFDGANLTGAVLAGSDLDHASFMGANLTDADISSASLDGTAFDGANLTRTKLSMISFKNTSFQGATFAGTNFYKSDLDGLSFEGATLSHVIFDGTSLKNSSFQGATLLQVTLKPFFAVTNKYYRMIQTIQFDGAAMDKLTYNVLRGMGANLSGVTVL